MDDLISRQAAIDALDVLCQEHRYKIPGKGETYSQYNEAWQDALDRAEGAIFNLPPAEPQIIYCNDCRLRDEIDKRYASILDCNGTRYSADHRELKKTGKHYDIQSILEAMRK